MLFSFLLETYRYVSSSVWKLAYKFCSNYLYLGWQKCGPSNSDVKDESENCYTNIVLKFTLFLKVMNCNKDRILFERNSLSWKRFTRIKILQQWWFILLPAGSWHCVICYMVQRNILPHLQGRILYIDQWMYLLKYKS